MAPCLVLLMVLVLTACQSPAELLFSYTGEEGLLRQIRGMGQWAAYGLHPQPDLAPDVPVAHTGANPFGTNVFLNQEVEPQKRERSVAIIAEAGFHWLRQEFPWEDIEIHAKGDFEDRRNDLDGDGVVDAIDAWAKYDQIVDLAETYGLEVIPRLSNPPAWTRAAGDKAGTYGPPDDLADWGDYVYAVVSRYRGQVRAYQLWNEPNIYPEWGEQPVDPQGYTQLLCEGYRRAKQADPGAIIVSGALAPTVSLNPGPGPATGMNEFVFLQRMYDAGAAECFDVLAVNNYMLWSGPTDRRLRPDVINFSRPIYVRDVMVANGDAAKPIWISEMNANAVPNDPDIAGLGAYGQVTLEQQARYAPLAYQRAMAEWPWVGVVNFWFFKRPSDAERNQSWYYFRMMEPDFSPLPVYHTMKAYLNGLTPVLYRGVHQETHWALIYDGAWETVEDTGAELGARRRATAPGATLCFTYEGGTLILTPGPGGGEIEVSIDGGPPRQISLEGQPVRLTGRWRLGRHEVTLTAVTGEVAVDSLTVRPLGPRLALPGLPAVLLVGLGFVVIWMGVGAWRRRDKT